jgi:HEAT repeat protein
MKQLTGSIYDGTASNPNTRTLQTVGPAAAIAVPELTRIVQAGDDLEAQVAAEILSVLKKGSTATVAFLRPRLSDPDPVTRLTAASTLAVIEPSDSQILQTLLELARSTDSQLQGLAIANIAEYYATNQQARDVLLQLYPGLGPVLPQTELEFAFGGVSGYTLSEESR